MSSKADQKEFAILPEQEMRNYYEIQNKRKNTSALRHFCNKLHFKDIGKKLQT